MHLLKSILGREDPFRPSYLILGETLGDFLFWGFCLTVLEVLTHVLRVVILLALRYWRYSEAKEGVQVWPPPCLGDTVDCIRSFHVPSL